jgi:hypothetical protein
MSVPRLLLLEAIPLWLAWYPGFLSSSHALAYERKFCVRFGFHMLFYFAAVSSCLHLSLVPFFYSAPDIIVWYVLLVVFDEYG